MKKGDRVYCADEHSLATVVSVDEFCESAVIRLDSDGVEVDASWLQITASDSTN